MPWMQRQSHLFDANTRLICRYHRLSTRFELIAEHVPSASGGLDSNLSDHNLVNGRLERAYPASILILLAENYSVQYCAAGVSTTCLAIINVAQSGNLCTIGKSHD